MNGWGCLFLMIICVEEDAPWACFIAFLIWILGASH